MPENYEEMYDLSCFNGTQPVRIGETLAAQIQSTINNNGQVHKINVNCLGLFREDLIIILFAI